MCDQQQDANSTECSTCKSRPVPQLQATSELYAVSVWLGSSSGCNSGAGRLLLAEVQCRAMLLTAGCLQPLRPLTHHACLGCCDGLVVGYAMLRYC
jgi:hypothetical protein